MASTMVTRLATPVSRARPEVHHSSTPAATDILPLNLTQPKPPDPFLSKTSTGTSTCNFSLTPARASRQKSKASRVIIRALARIQIVCSKKERRLHSDGADQQDTANIKDFLGAQGTAPYPPKQSQDTPDSICNRYGSYQFYKITRKMQAKKYSNIALHQRPLCP